MNNSSFEYNAPEYYDFTAADDDDGGDSFFEINWPNENNSFEERFFTPAATKNTMSLRRASSVGDLPTILLEEKIIKDEEILSNHMENLKVKDNLVTKEPSSKADTRTSRAKSSTNLGKRSSSMNRYRSSSSINSSSSSKENLNRLAQPKRKYVSKENLTSNDYISMAEAVNKFQKGTPIRFRSRPTAIAKTSIALKTTVPFSPALMTKTRLRPTTAIPQEERELLEYEEQQQFKIRAHPIKKGVLKGPVKSLVVEKKSATIPQPFNITVQVKKDFAVKEDVFEFHAKPAPKTTCGRKPATPTKKQPTKPITPNVLKKYKHSKSVEELKPKENIDPKPFVPTRTIPAPFSFEKRDLYVQKKKEKLINQVLEEEKKAREFHAQPPPKYLRSKNNSETTSLSSYKSNRSEENLEIPKFKAKPAIVLQTAPFVPKKPDRPLIEIQPFNLASERRAKERKEFDEKTKQKIEEVELLKKLEEQNRLIEEEQEIAKRRREAEKKANPIKKYKPVVIQPSKKVTNPVSPNFMSRQK